MCKKNNILRSDREYHNKISPQYDEWYVRPLQYQLANAEFLADVASFVSPKDGLLVELGAGTGAMAIPLHDRGYDVLAVDASEGMLARLTSKRPELETLQADVSRPLPVRNASVGCVIISQALHHIPEQEAVLREAFRILRSQGKLCIFEPQLLPKSVDFIRRIARDWCCPGNHVDSEQPIDPGKLKMLVRDCGFSLVKCATTFFFPFNPRLVIARTIVRLCWAIPSKIPFIGRLGGVLKICARKV